MRLEKLIKMDLLYRTYIYIVIFTWVFYPYQAQVVPYGLISLEILLYLYLQLFHLSIYIMEKRWKRYSI